MHDAFLKSVFADRRMVEILIHGHAPEWAAKIDFSTLREESTGLVSKKTLQRRHPDMIWSADTVDAERVLFLLEFQRTTERLMALRTTTYTALTLEGIAAGPDFRPGDPLPEFVYLVLYHGDGPWTAPANVADLFQRSDPGRYRVVPWGEGTGDDRSRDDLTALVLGLARNLSPEDMAVQLSGLWRAIERHGDPGLAGLIVRTVDTMLQLRDYPARLTKEGAKTMAEVVDRFQQ
ncbi:MAG: Rpn family recombination-promoting nuclease/putative transposase, partial [Gemmatimonadetes bacterium]|nr:Rpn family recombination-promoting nuclease/putative transposase [Gemmatimonadota bacterium]